MMQECCGSKDAGKSEMEVYDKRHGVVNKENDVRG